MSADVQEPMREGPPLATVPPEPKPKGRAPLDETRRAAAAKKQKVRRVIDKLKQAKDDAQLDQLMREQLEPGSPVASAPSTAAPPVDSAAEAAKHLEAAQLYVAQANRKFLKGTRYELDADGETILSRGVAPCLQKYAAKMSSPEGGLIVAVLIVWGRPLLEDAGVDLRGLFATPAPPASSPPSEQRAAA